MDLCSRESGAGGCNGEPYESKIDPPCTLAYLYAQQRARRRTDRAFETSSCSTLALDRRRHDWKNLEA